MRKTARPEFRRALTKQQPMRNVNSSLTKTPLKGEPVTRGRRLRSWSGLLILGVTLFGVAGCQSLAPPSEQQLQAAEEMHRDVNPEFAEAAEVVGTLLYHLLHFFP
jgi:hypothetical protein